MSVKASFLCNLTVVSAFPPKFPLTSLGPISSINNEALLTSVQLEPGQKAVEVPTSQQFKPKNLLLVPPRKKKSTTCLKPLPGSQHRNLSANPEKKLPLKYVEALHPSPSPSGPIGSRIINVYKERSVVWIKFLYSRNNKVELHTIRCDVHRVPPNKLKPEYKTVAAAVHPFNTLTYF